MNTHKEESKFDCPHDSRMKGVPWCSVCDFIESTKSPVEPTPPSQIEEESQTQRSLREMYELGKEHGRTLALKDMEIEKLMDEVGLSGCRNKADHQGHGNIWWDGHDTAKREVNNTK